MKLVRLALSAALILVPAAAIAQPPTGRTIYNRKVDQQARIAQGARSGQLTPRETAHLERQESRINREERVMRAENGGHLTRHDRRILTRQQNRESARIYREKHNGFRR
jgi:hypothetical protein